MAIVKNAIRCNHCKDEIESVHRHDFKYCKCGKVAVDGGKDYLKRAFQTTPETDYTELSVEK
jgi:Zn finger protein HypA/HybF involved in hydrogenase expression